MNERKQTESYPAVAQLFCSHYDGATFLPRDPTLTKKNQNNNIPIYIAYYIQAAKGLKQRVCDRWEDSTGLQGKSVSFLYFLLLKTKKTLFI